MILVDVKNLVRYYPSWMPWGSWQKDAARLRQQYTDLLDLPYNDVKANRVSLSS